MADKMLWIAKKDGKGWSSNRTRDIVDLAFTVTPESDSEYATVTVRCTWHDGETARARRIIGRMYFLNHKTAKKTVETYIEMINGYPHLSKGDARDSFMSHLLADSYTHSKNGALPAFYQDSTGMMAYSTTLPVSTEMTETIQETKEMVEEVIDISMLKPGDPAPAGYIWMGKELVRIGWPS